MFGCENQFKTPKNGPFKVWFSLTTPHPLGQKDSYANSFKLFRDVALTGSSPERMSARIAVGAV